MNNTNNYSNIIGYDPQTGQPIYGSNMTPGVNNNVPNSNSFSPAPQPNWNVQSANNPNFYKKKSGVGKWIALGVFVLIILVGIIAGLVIFLKNGDSKEKSRTLMIYMVGADLESSNGLATTDLEGMNYDELDHENVNVVLIVGGSTRWRNDYIDPKETSIFELTADGYKKVKQQSLQNMGDDEVLRDFLNYVYENYKTDEYDLLFWDHGSAINGGEHDELSGDNLSLQELNTALATSPFANKKLESIIFRTCLNGSLEVAGILKNYANYLVASEEITIGYRGEDVLDFVHEIEPTDDGYDIGVKFINSYKEQVNSYRDYFHAVTGESEYIYSTYSVIDLSAIDELEKSVNDFFDSIDIGSNYNTIAKVRSNLYQYAYNFGDESSYDMVDLYNLVSGLRDLSPEKAERVLTNLENIVLYNYATNDQSRGLSIYFPFNGEDIYKQYFLKIYKQLSSLAPYGNFIERFYTLQKTPTGGTSFSNTELKVDSSSEADFVLELDEDQKAAFAKASYFVFKADGEGYYHPIYVGGEVSLDGNLLKASIRDRQLKVVSDEDGSEYLLTLTETDETDSFIKYRASVLLEDFRSEDPTEWRMDNSDMSLIYDKQKGTIQIGSVILRSDDELKPNSVAVDLKDYQVLAFVNSKYKILDENGNYKEDWEGNGIIEGFEEKVDKFHFELQDFGDDSDYYCVFVIRDIYNQVYYSKLVKMN